MGNGYDLMSTVHSMQWTAKQEHKVLNKTEENNSCKTLILQIQFHKWLHYIHEIIHSLVTLTHFLMTPTNKIII